MSTLLNSIRPVGFSRTGEHKYSIVVNGVSVVSIVKKSFDSNLWEVTDISGRVITGPRDYRGRSEKLFTFYRAKELAIEVFRKAKNGSKAEDVA